MKLVFSPDGRLPAAAGRAELLVWDTATRRLVDIGRRGSGSDTVISDVAFSPDGQLVVTAKAERRLCAGSAIGSPPLWRRSAPST